MKSISCSLRYFICFAPLVLGGMQACKTRQFGGSASKAVIAPGSKDDPYAYFPDFRKNMAQLPLQGQVPPERIPWVDTYWPINRGGMAVRWFGSQPQDGGTYPLKSRDDILAMAKNNPEQLKTLSPVEKYDIFMGRYDFPTVRYVNSITGPKIPKKYDDGSLVKNPDGSPVLRSVATWEGFCHGWAAAAILYPEPRPVVGVNPEGVQVPFGSSDIKALLTLYQGYERPLMERPAEWNDDIDGEFKAALPDSPDAPSRPNPAEKFLGMRCRSYKEKALGKCSDINAGAFHVMLTNLVGISGRPFVYNGASKRTEIWNFPVFAYSVQVLAEEKPTFAQKRQGISKVTAVQTTVQYAAETDPDWEPMNGTPKYKSNSQIYSYEIEMDDLGNILGGKWKLGSPRPDFMWVQEPAVFQGAHWQGIPRLIGRF